jgi:acetyltransferase-like isoleucine patch superfamily enzyme
MNILTKTHLAFSSIWYAFLLFLPDEYSFLRVKYYNRKGCKIHKNVAVSSNVRLRGKVVIDEGTSIAQNSSISGEVEGVFIGKNVMIAPNVTIVAFNHGFELTNIPMVIQKNTEKMIVIEDDVWIGANCTIGKGVKICKGSIIGANSFVNRDIPPFSIFGGVPVKFIKSRIQ